VTSSGRFPAGFLWGAATSSHQVEGNNRFNDWWEYEQAGRLPYASGEACRQYELYTRDFELARSLGHTAHRFSIEWSRLEPEEGHWNEEALAHYRDVLHAVRSNGMEPVVTLHHFTNPAWFTRRGGWTRVDSPDLFARYVARLVPTLRDAVKFWLTINEPTVYVTQGYVTGEWPPCRRGAWAGAARTLRNLARAHVAAYHVLHELRADAMVGFAHSAPVIQPCNPRRAGDRQVARVRDYVLNEVFFRLIGSRAEPPPRNAALDFVGLNYYMRQIVRRSGLGLGAVVGHVCRSDHHERGPMSTMGWEMYPAGLTTMLQRFSKRGLPIMVTENGIATEDEQLRRDFLVEHVAAAADAIEGGVDLIGYLYWSLIDNFEWAFGTAPKFGLAAVDFATQERRPRPVAEDFAARIRASDR
jgi:beta-glucosidase